LVENLNNSVNLQTAGTRGLDLLLRLETSGANVSIQDNMNSIQELVESLSKKDSSKKVQLVLATYTAMLEFRSELGKIVDLQGIGGKGN
jgi:MurT ligase C-terminal